MKAPNHPAIRAYLRKHPDGATLNELATELGRSRKSVRNSVISMPDVYLDRWTDPVRGQHQAVYCIVIPPPNCPHPKDRHVQSHWNRKFFMPEGERRSVV